MLAVSLVQWLIKFNSILNSDSSFAHVESPELVVEDQTERPDPEKLQIEGTCQIKKSKF